MRQLLKDLAVICAGQGAPQGDNNYCENGTPFVKAGNLQELLEGKAITSIQKVSDEVAKKHKLKLYPKGTILFAKSGMSCMKGYVYVLPQSAYVVSHLACITPNEDASEYLRYFFNYHKPNQLVKDAAYPSISLSDIGNLVVDMKSESERNAIVSVLQHAESVIALRQKELQKLDELVKSRFIELFGNCKNESLIGDVVSISRGASPRPISAFITDSEDGVNWIKIGDVSENSLYITKTEERITPDGAKKSRMVHKGDFILSNSMSFGRPYILGINGCVHDGWLIMSDFKESFNELYLYYALRSDDVQYQFSGKVNGATVKNLNSNLVKNTYIKVPPMEIQEQFASFVEQTDKSKLAVQQGLQELELLKKSLMQQYFG